MSRTLISIPQPPGHLHNHKQARSRSAPQSTRGCAVRVRMRGLLEGFWAWEDGGGPPGDRHKHLHSNTAMTSLAASVRSSGSRSMTIGRDKRGLRTRARPQTVDLPPHGSHLWTTGAEPWSAPLSDVMRRRHTHTWRQRSLTMDRASLFEAMEMDLVCTKACPDKGGLISCVYSEV